MRTVATCRLAMRSYIGCSQKRAEAGYVAYLTQDDKEEFQESIERILTELRNYTVRFVTYAGALAGVLGPREQARCAGLLRRYVAVLTQ